MRVKRGKFKKNWWCISVKNWWNREGRGPKCLEKLMSSFMNGPFAHWREFSVANNVSLLAYSLPHRCCSHPARFVLAARIAWPTKNEKKNHVVIDTRWWLYSCTFMIIKVDVCFEHLNVVFWKDHKIRKNLPYFLTFGGGAGVKKYEIFFSKSCGLFRKHSLYCI